MTPHEDNFLITAFDQPIVADNEWVMKKVDEKLLESLKKKDVFIALEMCKQLVAIEQVTGLALSKALYFLEKNWEKYGIEDAFTDVVFEYIGKHKHTIDRYVKVWGLFDNAVVPQNHVEELQQGNIGLLFPIANAIYEGHEISEDNWDKLVEAPDVSTVLKIIRDDVKGVPPRKGSLQLYLYRDGSIWAFFNNERYFVGSLEVEAKEEPIQRAIERIKKNTGILES